MINAERARELIEYDAQSGQMTWRQSMGRRRAGAEAGRIVANGYRRMWIDGREYAAHRVAWLIVTGSWPEGDVDHVDMDRQHNAWRNLRACDRSANMHNTKAKRGIKGVSWDRITSKWRASAHIHGKSRNLGRYECLGLAISAYRKACTDAYGEMARFA